MTNFVEDEGFVNFSEAAAIGLIALDGEQNVVYWNSWITRASGVDLKNALGKPLTITFPEIKSSRLIAAVAATISDRSASVLTYKVNKILFPFTATEGAPRPMMQSIIMTPNSMQREKSGCFIQVFDVTYDAEREALLKKQAEDLRELKKIADGANRAKSEFLASMSHEIRTPMNGVIGMVDILSQMDMEPEQYRMIKTIRESSFSLLAIIDDILDTSKIEAGKLRLESVPVQLEAILEEIIMTVTSIADTNNVRLHLFVDPNLPKWIHSDPVRLRQILMNLLSNAVKFSKAKPDAPLGHVMLRAECQEADELKISVTDNGIGMSEESVARLFRPFTQAEQSTTRRFGGTGLGLVIANTLIEMMGGAIEVESTLRAGSKFTVLLPFKESEGAETGPDIAGLKLLALVDKGLTQQTITEYLEANGATLRYAENEAELSSWMAADEKATVLLAHETSAENDRIQKSLLDASGQRKFLHLTAQRTDKMGLVEPNSYVVPRYPVLPSDLYFGLAVLAGRTTPEATRKKEPGSAPYAPSTAEAESQNRLVLLVEDNETNQQVIIYQLDMLGYAAEIANDGKQGLEMWESGRFDLVLSDCHMPEMDGLEMTKAIREIEGHNGYSPVPIIAITANALQGDADICLAAGMDDYLSKPVELKRLGAMLHRWIPEKGGN